MLFTPYNNMLERIICILADYLETDPAELDENTLLYMEYNLDEICTKEMIEKLNEEFEIEIAREEFEELDTIQDITEYIESIM